MIALVTDLIFATKIRSTAASLKVNIKAVRSIEQLAKHLQSEPGSPVMVDLNCDGADPLEAIRLIKRSSPQSHTIAYVSHEQADLIKAARAAGADEVMARSAFVIKLPELLKNFAAEP